MTRQIKKGLKSAKRIVAYAADMFDPPVDREIDRFLAPPGVSDGIKSAFRGTGQYMRQASKEAQREIRQTQTRLFE